tara:strand:- start:253 stop:1050 length:798 start_codon:yes stop_codon:yes gene_type:complete
MKNFDYTYNDVETILRSLKLKKNDSVFLSTSLGMLGIPSTVNKNYFLISSKWLLKSIKKIIGKKGNIFVPTYSYTFGKKKKVFNPKKTKADIGYFPNFFLKQKKITRSSDPMMSIAGIGPDCRKILLKNSNSSFGKNCVLERLFLIKNLKCLHVGLSYNWMPFMHYLDWKNKVPFRFDKRLSGYIIANNKKKKIHWIYFARILRDETFSNGFRIGIKALKKKLYMRLVLGKSMIYIIDYRKFYNFSKYLTKKNKWLTVDGPKFKT